MNNKHRTVGSCVCLYRDIVCINMTVSVGCAIRTFMFLQTRPMTLLFQKRGRMHTMNWFHHKRCNDMDLVLFYSHKQSNHPTLYIHGHSGFLEAASGHSLVVAVSTVLSVALIFILAQTRAITEHILSDTDNIWRLHLFLSLIMEVPWVGSSLLKRWNIELLLFPLMPLFLFVFFGFGDGDVPFFSFPASFGQIARGQLGMTRCSVFISWRMHRLTPWSHGSLRQC